MSHPCPQCGKQTDGAWSEGGFKWAICQDCMDAEREIEWISTSGRAMNRAAEDEEDNQRRRHPMDFDIWPSDEQAEAFKRGER